MHDNSRDESAYLDTEEDEKEDLGFNPIFVTTDPVASYGIWPRVREETVLLLAQIHYFMFCYLIGSWIHSVFRNLSFLRYPVEPPMSWALRDLGYELLPEMQVTDKYRGIENWPKNWLERTCTFMAYLTLFWNSRGSEKPHTIN